MKAGVAEFGDSLTPSNHPPHLAQTPTVRPSCLAGWASLLLPCPHPRTHWGVALPSLRLGEQGQSLIPRLWRLALPSPPGRSDSRLAQDSAGFPRDQLSNRRLQLLIPGLSPGAQAAFLSEAEADPLSGVGPRHPELSAKTGAPR